MILKDYDFIEERQNELINSYPIYEMAMKGGRMSDKFGEIIGSIVDNIACICMYPENPTIPHWKERTCGLCKRFIDINIDPLKNNTPDFRKKCLNKGVIEELDEDYGAVLNHFKSVSIHYSKKDDKLIPYKPYEQCYNENKEQIDECINSIVKYVAEQDYEGLIEYIDKFNPLKES